MFDPDVVRVLLSSRNPFQLRSRALDEVLSELETDEETLRATGLVRVFDGEVGLVDLEGVPEAWKRRMQVGFDERLVRQQDSPAYTAFNLAIHGAAAFRFSMHDDDQLERMLQLSNLGEGQRFVDVGCAVGSLTALTAERTGATGLGIDFAPTAIERARRDHGSDRLQFEVADLDDLAVLGDRGPFDVALAFDTLYFPLDLPETLRQIAGLLVPGGRIVASFTHRIAEGAVSDDPADCRLAEALGATGWDWVALDVTPNGLDFWMRSSAALDELESRFEEHGDHDLWERRRAETDAMLASYEEGRARRYLFAAMAPA